MKNDSQTPISISGASGNIASNLLTSSYHFIHRMFRTNPITEKDIPISGNWEWCKVITIKLDMIFVPLQNGFQWMNLHHSRIIIDFFILGFLRLKPVALHSNSIRTSYTWENALKPCMLSFCLQRVNLVLMSYYLSHPERH